MGNETLGRNSRIQNSKGYSRGLILGLTFRPCMPGRDKGTKKNSNRSVPAVVWLLEALLRSLMDEGNEEDGRQNGAVHSGEQPIERFGGRRRRVP